MHVEEGPTFWGALEADEELLPGGKIGSGWGGGGKQAGSASAYTIVKSAGLKRDVVCVGRWRDG